MTDPVSDDEGVILLSCPINVAAISIGETLWRRAKVGERVDFTDEIGWKWRRETPDNDNVRKL